MMATGTHQIVPLPTRAISAPSTTTLSASGSRNAPDRVAPWRRATQPSIPSVTDKTPQITIVTQLAPHKMIKAMSKGVARRRSTVMPLAGVINAEGPNV